MDNNWNYRFLEISRMPSHTKCIPRDFLEYFTRLLSYDVTVTSRETERELPWKIVNLELLWRQLRDCVSGEQRNSLWWASIRWFKDNYSTSSRVIPWQEYYKLFNKLIGSVDKWCSFCLLNCTVTNNSNSLSS